MRRSKYKYRLTIRWLAGHIGIGANEKTDAEAKRAAGGHTSDTELLPPHLRKPLLINLSAVKRKQSKKLKSEWKDL